jgi:hypothetical protein
VPASVGLDTLLHFAATMMLAAGVPLKVVSAFGHAGVAITGGTYGQVSRAFLRRRWLGSAAHSNEKRWSRKVVKRKDDLETRLIRITNLTSD